MISLSRLSIMSIVDVEHGSIVFQRDENIPPMLMGLFKRYEAGCPLGDGGHYKAFVPVPKEEMDGIRMVISNLDFQVDLSSRIAKNQLQQGDLGLSKTGVALAAMAVNRELSAMTITGEVDAVGGTYFWFRRWQIVTGEGDTCSVVYCRP